MHELGGRRSVNAVDHVGQPSSWSDYGRGSSVCNSRRSLKKDSKTADPSHTQSNIQHQLPIHRKDIKSP